MATATLYFDKRARRADGTFPLKITITHKRQTARINLNVYIAEEQWNAKTRRIQQCPNKEALNTVVYQRLLDVRGLLIEMQQRGELAGKSATSIRDEIRRKLDGEDTEVTFGDWYQTFSAKHENRRTREIYDETLKWINRFDPRAAKSGFSYITKDWLDRFFVFMASTSPSVNARNIHLRNIRAVFNDAIDNGITDAYPFRRLKIKPVATAKRNLRRDVIADLFNAEVKPWQQKYVDAFKLMFFLIGINVGDLCELKPTNVHGDRLEYIRKKTHKLYSIKLEPEAVEVIGKYKSRKGLLLSFADNCKYRHFGYRCNLTLSKLVPGVTTYWARHSWATIAANLDIPEDVISLALGHLGTNSTTDIYIERDRRKIDAANRKVMDFVLYGKQ